MCKSSELEVAIAMATTNGREKKKKNKHAQSKQYRSVYTISLIFLYIRESSLENCRKQIYLYIF